jgi:PAS domain S-box-containing protein
MKNIGVKSIKGKKRSAGKTPSPDLSSDDREVLFKILQSKTSLYFEKYKKDVVARRVYRRMGLLAISSITEYVALLQDGPTEADRLANDLMIGVTGFFRDPAAWDALGTDLVAKFASENGSPKPFRVWVPACSTGEEAYTIAMTLTRLAEAPNGAPKVFQIFATDINEKALCCARAGVYPDDSAADLPNDHLDRYFTKWRDGVSLQINKNIRDSVVFARQNILVDPPFSKVDLIICRNLFIYLEPDAQNKCIELFHYALNPEGYLFMGNAESVGKRYSLFKSLGNKKCRLYKRVGPSRLQWNKIPLLFPAGSLAHGALPSAFAPDDSSIHAIAQRELLKKFAPAAVVINKSYGIVYYNGPVNKYLSQPGGAPTNKLLDQAPEDLRNRLRRHCSQVIHDNKPRVMLATFPGKNKTPLKASVSISPLSATGVDGGLYVVSFEEYTASKVLEKTDVEPCGADEPIIRQLEHELSSTRDELQGNIEQLKSLNEEMHSSNEELQAANEELETSREELQSLNEELVTVNTQLQETVEAQEVTKNDLNNFFTSTDIPTMFLDRNLRIKRFTPAMTRIVKFIDADIGRSFSEFTQEYIGPELTDDAQEVLAKLSAVTREVECKGAWFIRRALPYRTTDDRIEGVVVTFTDITGRKRQEDEIRALAKFPSENPNPILRVSPEGMVLYANKAGGPLLRLWGCAVGEAISGPWRGKVAKTFAAKVQIVEDVECGGRVYSFAIVPVVGAGYVNFYGRDVTERKNVERERERLRTLLEAVIENSPAGLAVLDYPGYEYLIANKEHRRRVGADGEIIGRSMLDVNQGTSSILKAAFDEVERTKMPYIKNDVPYMTEENGGLKRRYSSLIFAPLLDNNNDLFGIMSIGTDTTDRVESEQALRDIENRFKTIAEALPALISLSSSEDSTIVFTNSAYNEAFGFRKGELVGRQGPDVYFDPLDREKIIEAIKTNGFVNNYQIKAKKSDGTPIWLLSSVRPINYGGKPAMLGASIDITDRIKAEESLQASRSQVDFLASIIESSTQPFGVGYPDGRLGLINKAFELLTGYSGDELRTIDWGKALTPPEWREIEQKKLAELNDSGVAVRYEKEYLRKDGTRVPIELLVHVVKDGDVRPLYYYSFLTDITERKKAEETLRASEERYRTLFNSLIEGFCIIEMVFDADKKPVDYRFLEINEAFEEQTGLHDAQGKLMRDLAPDHEEHWFEIYGKIAVTGEPAEFVNEAKALDRWFEVYAFRMGGSDSRKVAICFSDITERKKAEDELREQNEISNAILNATTETLWLMDLEGNILGANETAAKRLGKTVTEVVGKNGFALTPPHVKELRRAKIREMTQTGKAVQFHDERDGIIFHHTFYPVRDALGAVKGLVIFSRDITEQKKAEDALRISEARFRTMFERHQAVMLLIEPDSGAIVDANAAASNFYGYSKERLLSLKIHDLNRLSRENVAEELKKALAERKTNFVFPHRLANGEVRLVEVYSSPTDVQGKKLLFSIIHDITERKKNERELKQINRTLSAHSKSSQAMMRAEDENKYLNEVCKIVTEDCGYAMVWIGYAENDDGKTVRPMASAGFDEGYLEQLDITWSDTKRGRGPTGTAIRSGKPGRCRNMLTDPNFAPWREEALCRGYASSLVLPLLNENKAFGAITIYSKEPDAFAEDEVKLLSDIADDLAYGILAIRMQEARILAEETIIKERNFCNAIIQTTSGQIVVLDPEGRIELFNHACEKATGYSYHELKGKPFWDYLLLPEEKDIVKDVFNKIKNGSVTAEMEFENYWVAKDSSKRFIRWANSALKDAQGKVELVIGTGIDLSDDKINREKIEELNTFLMQKTLDLSSANKELEAFSYSVSHDLRGPLRSIDGFSKLLLEEYGPMLDDQAKDYVNRVCTSVGRMSQLIDDLLRLSRISRQEIVLTKTDLSHMVCAITEDLRAIEPRRLSDIIVGPGLLADVDARLMRIALENLLGNAWKFTSKRERARIEFGAAMHEGKPVFFVRDNGAGFKNEYVNRIFAPFQRLHSEKQFPGSGIGLAIVQRIIQRHGGSIWAEGGEDKGAVFYFTVENSKGKKS